MEDKRVKLEAMKEEIENLSESPLHPFRKANNYLLVFGEGNIDADIMFIGEAPGEQEAKTGRPFVGRAGRLLSDLLQSVGLRREDVYITNIVKDRPPDNRAPRVEEIKLYAPFLMRQIDIIRPKVIVTLGRFAMDFILEFLDAPQRGKKITELHGTFIEGNTSFGSIRILPLYHPAATFYSPDTRQALQNDFYALKQYV